MYYFHLKKQHIYWNYYKKELLDFSLKEETKFFFLKIPLLYFIIIFIKFLNKKFLPVFKL